MRLHHVGIAVPDLEAALDSYRVLGFQELERGRVEAFNVAVCMLDAGGARLELLAPTGPGAIQSFLDKRGPGLHHTAFAVDDIAVELARLKAEGVSLVDETSRTGFGGHQVAFLHPKSAGGVLIELVETD